MCIERGKIVRDAGSLLEGGLKLMWLAPYELSLINAKQTFAPRRTISALRRKPLLARKSSSPLIPLHLSAPAGPEHLRYPPRTRNK